MRETIRRAGAGASTLSPASSTITRPWRAAGRLVHAWVRRASARRKRERINQVRMGTAHPRTEGWAVSDSSSAVGRHLPSPEGIHGGANEEVSWLRAFARLPGSPVAYERS